MNNNGMSQEYANDLMFDLEKAFWDERGLGARFRMTNVGKEHFKTKVLPHLQSTNPVEMVKTIETALKEEGIVSQVTAQDDGRLLRVRVAGCAHRNVEDRMVKLGIPPFTCVPANLIALAIEEKLDRPVELAEIKVEDGACNLLLVLFDQRPVLR